MFPLLAALVLLAAQLPAQQPARHAIEPLAAGHIDWTQHALFAYGDGTAPTAISDPVQQRLHGLRNARDAAFRNMRQLIGQVRIDANTQLQDAGLQRDFQQLARVAVGSQSADQGRYRIAVRLLLLGDFAAAVLPQVEPVDPRSHDLSDNSPDSLTTPDSLDALVPLDSLTTPTTPDSIGALVPLDSLNTPAPPDSLTPTPVDSLNILAAADSLADDELVFFVPESPYTGLLVDVRGLGLQPNLAPRLLSADGHVIHGAATVSRSLATDYGVAGYDDDIDRAYTSQRLGGDAANPLIVRATSTAGLYSGDAILDNFDAAQVLQADEVGDFLRHGRVTFLLGPEPAALDSVFISEGMEHEFELYREMEPSDSPE